MDDYEISTISVKTARMISNMNLNTFLKNVDDRLADMTEEQVKSFIHELARNADEEYRLSFLQALNQAAERDPKSKKVLEDGSSEMRNHLFILQL